MKYRLVAVFLIFSIFGVQVPMAAPTSTASPQPPAPAVSPMASETVTVASGTTIPLTLLSPIKSKSTKPGDAVRAVVAFPVTVGTQLAIPAGTYVEGVVNAVTAQTRHTRSPSVQIHFLRLLFSNGYSVALDAVNTEAMLILPSEGSQATYEIADARGGAPFLGKEFASPGQSSTVPTQLPRVGPNPAVVIPAVLGGVAGLMVVLFTLSRHSAKNADYLLYDNGWQFQMVLESPLTLDAVKVAAAASATPRS